MIEICLSIGESQNNNGISQTGVEPGDTCDLLHCSY